MSLAWVLVYGFLGLSTLLNIIVPFSGSATITPVLALLLDPHKAIAVASVFYFLGAPPRIYFFRKHIRWEEVHTLLLPSAVAAALGALALIAVPPHLLLGIILAFAVYFLLKKLGVLGTNKKRIPVVDSFIGLLSGFLQGTGLSGSDLRNQYLYAEGLSLAEVHGTTAIIGGTNFLIATIIRFYTGQLTIPDAVPVLYLFPIIVLATWLGRHALYKLSKRTTDAIILTVMIAVIIGISYRLLV